MAAINPKMSIITLNINDLNIPMKSDLIKSKTELHVFMRNRL